MPKTFQDQLDDLIAQFVSPDKVDEAKKVLTPLNEALTRTFKSYSDDIDAAKMRLRSVEGVKPEEYTKMETRVKELETELNEFKGKYDVANKALVETKGKLTGTMKETAIRKALTDAKLRIAPDAMEEVFGSLDRRVVTKDDGSFVIPSTIISKDAAGTEIKTPVEYQVAEYLTKEWAVTPYAKRVLLADFSSGGGAAGAVGANGSGGSKPWKDMSLDERTAFYKVDPVAAQKLIDTK